MKLVHIYGIEDPRTGSIVYVGRSKNPRNRLANMKGRARAGETGALYETLRDILVGGDDPAVRTLETVGGAEETAAELAWIDYLRSTGEPLVNIQGGGGPSSTAAISRRTTRRHPNQEATQFQPLDPASPTVTMNVKLPQELLDRVDVAARAAGVNRSAFVRDALAAALDATREP